MEVVKGFDDIIKAQPSPDSADPKIKVKVS